jgi:hypothetical protein
MSANALTICAQLFSYRDVSEHCELLRKQLHPSIQLLGGQFFFSDTKEDTAAQDLYRFSRFPPAPVRLQAGQQHLHFREQEEVRWEKAWRL